MLHHFFSTFGLGEKVAHLHADNCSGQNKNRYMMYYLMWRVLTGQHDEITISFLPVGHTKFLPDAGFGMLKRKFRLTNVGCLSDIVSVVNKSAAMNHTQLVGDQSGNVMVETYDWSTFFEDQVIKSALKGMKSYSHFRFTSTHPGTVYIRKSCETIDKGVRRSSCLKICHGGHYHQISPLSSNQKAYLHKGSGICMIKSGNLFQLKPRIWCAHCPGRDQLYPPMMMMMNNNLQLH